MNTPSMEGKCLCGAVSLQARLNREVEACHCGMCRQWGGGPYLSIHCGADTAIWGAEHIAEYASSDWATRCFCRVCGTHLFYRIKSSDGYEVPAGLFRQQEAFELTKQIFIDRKPDFYAFANSTQVLTEAEVFAQFAPQ